MASTRRGKEDQVTPRPATTEEGSEAQLVSLAFKLARKQLTDGTASAQVQGHFLKLGSSREGLEQTRLRHEIDLLEAKVESLQGAKRMEDLMTDAIKAFGIYNGSDTEEEEFYD